ncbi:hypothetical protein BGZ98_003571 [Dissophora globulifera]|nr:hypothetical protein BGZ98_003571 [Dissophora globulifera]
MILERFHQQSFISKRMLLAPAGMPNNESEDCKTELATHNFSGDTSKKDDALIETIVDISGPCVKIDPDVMKVFERLHLVFYRSREYTDRPALQEAILAKIGRRTFPTYDITRTNTVFRNRVELLNYEAALRMHYELSKMIESAAGPGRGAVIYVHDNDNRPNESNSNSSNTRRSNSTRSNSKKTIGDSSSGDSTPANGNEDDTVLDREEKNPEQERRRLEVVGIYEKVIEQAEGIRGAWREYVATETEMSKKCPNYFLLRFSPGWVYTQILRLELRAFAFLKRFEEESILLHELLDQQIYSLGQRGGWYDRLALVKSNYAFHKRLGKQEALRVCMMALRDRHVHSVEATSIQARIMRLESELKVAFRERHDFSYLTLRKAQKRILTGERLNTPGTAAPSYASSRSYSYVPNTMERAGHPTAMQRPLWRNIDGSDCSVEELALSYYRTLGYKGHHSENSLLSTLFGLLFWDILFSPQPGVFETSFQTEPLDLRTDAFFLQRQEMIIERIDDIAGSQIVECPDMSPLTAISSTECLSEAASETTRDTHCGELVSSTGENDEDDDTPLIDQRRRRQSHKPPNQDLANNTLCEVKLEQEQEQKSDEVLLAEKEQLWREEILARKRRECFYLDMLQRHDDLYREKKVYCVGVNWMYSKEELLQVAEGPGDRLSTTQQVWIDLLTSLGVDVELCLVQVAKDEDVFLAERRATN